MRELDSNLRCILLTPLETDMSDIDKDKKAKVSEPSAQKFLLGFKDGFLPLDAAAVAFLKIIRRSK